MSIGHEWKYPFLIVLIKVNFNGLNAAACRYCTKSVWLVVWYVLLIDVCTTVPFCLLFFSSKGSIYRHIYGPVLQLGASFRFVGWTLISCWKLSDIPHHIFSQLKPMCCGCVPPLWTLVFGIIPACMPWMIEFCSHWVVWELWKGPFMVFFMRVIWFDVFSAGPCTDYVFKIKKISLYLGSNLFNKHNILFLYC